MPRYRNDRDLCAACRTPRRLRNDGRVERHKNPRPSDGGWNWRTPQDPGTCPGSGEFPLTLTPARSTEVLKAFGREPDDVGSI